MVAFESPETLLRPAAALLAWLATYAVHSTILLAAVLLVARWVSSARRREWLWKLGLVGGLVTSTWASVVSGGWSWQLGPIVTASVQRADPIGGPQGATAEIEAVDATPAAGPFADAAWAPNGVRRPAADVESSTAARQRPAFEPQVELASIRDRSQTERLGWAAGLSLAWAALALGSLLFTLARHRRWLRGLGRRVRGGGPLRSSLDAWSAVWAPAERVRISTTAELAAPVALGAREICVPTRAETELTAGEMRAMLGHELAHVRRCDPAWLWLAHSLERFFFFQPMHRWVRHRLQDDMELLSDDWTRKHHEPMELAKCLTRIAQWIGSPDECRERGIAPAMASHDSALVQRVERLLHANPERRSLAGGAALVGAVCVLSALAVARPHVAFAQEAPAEETAKADTSDGPALIDRVPLLSPLLTEGAAQDGPPESPMARVPLLSHLFTEGAAQDAAPEESSVQRSNPAEADREMLAFVRALFSDASQTDAPPEHPRAPEASPAAEIPLLSHLFAEGAAQDVAPESHAAGRPEISDANLEPAVSEAEAGLSPLLANVHESMFPSGESPAAQPVERQSKDAFRERLEGSIQRYLENQERARGGSAKGEGTHRLRSGDRLRVLDLVRPQETDVVVTVEGEGDVVLPELGVVRLIGLTREQVKRLLQERYSVYYTHTQIDVQVLPRASSYYVYGAVEQPGRYVLEGSCNVMQAVLYAVPRASSADLQRVQLLRGGDSAQRVMTDVARALRDPGAATPTVSARDIVFVPAKKRSTQASDAPPERGPVDRRGERHGDGFVERGANDAPNDALGIGGGNAEAAERFLGAVNADGSVQVTLEDHDGDGFVDVYAAESANDVLGIGGANAEAADRFLGGGSAQVTLEDYDGDGIADIYVTNDPEAGDEPTGRSPTDGFTRREIDEIIAREVERRRALRADRGAVEWSVADAAKMRKQLSRLVEGLHEGATSRARYRNPNADRSHQRTGSLDFFQGVDEGDGGLYQAADDFLGRGDGAALRKATDRYDPYADKGDQPVDAPDVYEGGGGGDSGLYEAADDFLGRGAGANREAVDRYDPYADTRDEPADAPDVCEGGGEGDGGRPRAADDFLSRRAGANREAVDRFDPYADSGDRADGSAADDFLGRTDASDGPADGSDSFDGFRDAGQRDDGDGGDEPDRTGEDWIASLVVRVAADGRVWMNGMPIFDPKRNLRSSLSESVRDYLSSNSYHERPFHLNVYVEAKTPESTLEAILGISNSHKTNRVSIHSWKDADAVVELTLRVVVDGNRLDPETGKAWKGEGPFAFDQTRQLAYEILLPGEPHAQALLPARGALRDQLRTRLRSVAGQIVEVDARAGVVYDDVRELTRILCENGYAVVFVGSKQ